MVDATFSVQRFGSSVITAMMITKPNEPSAALGFGFKDPGHLGLSCPFSDHLKNAWQCSNDKNEAHWIISLQQKIFEEYNITFFPPS